MSDLIFETIHGSHLYGLAHEGSDKDMFRVTTSNKGGAKHVMRDGVDVCEMGIDAFLDRALSGSHQSAEAMFSPHKTWGTGMEQIWGPMIEGHRITGPDVFKKYERTIKKFCFGDFKRRRHACRLSLNLADLRKDGRFNPVMSQVEIQLSNAYANELTGNDLLSGLVGWGG